MNYLYIVLVAVIIILVAKYVLKLDSNKITTLIANALVGTLLIWLLNLTGLVNIPLNWITVLVTGILGVPGVIILVILVLLKVI